MFHDLHSHYKAPGIVYQYSHLRIDNRLPLNKFHDHYIEYNLCFRRIRLAMYQKRYNIYYRMACTNVLHTMYRMIRPIYDQDNHIIVLPVPQSYCCKFLYCYMLLVHMFLDTVLQTHPVTHVRLLPLVLGSSWTLTRHSLTLGYSKRRNHAIVRL